MYDKPNEVYNQSIFSESGHYCWKRMVALVGMVQRQTQEDCVVPENGNGNKLHTVLWKKLSNLIGCVLTNSNLQTVPNVLKCLARCVQCFVLGSSWCVLIDIQSVQGFQSRLHIAHCNHSRDFSSRMAEVTHDYAIGIHVRLHCSNTFIT